MANEQAPMTNGIMHFIKAALLTVFVLGQTLHIKAPDRRAAVLAPGAVDEAESRDDYCPQVDHLQGIHFRFRFFFPTDFFARSSAASSFATSDGFTLSSAAIA